MIFLGRFWWVIAGACVAVVSFVLALVGKKQQSERMSALVSAAKAKFELDRLSEQGRIASASLMALDEQREAAKVAHREKAEKLGAFLRNVEGMTDTDVDAELERRGHK